MIMIMYMSHITVAFCICPLHYKPDVTRGSVTECAPRA